MLLELFVCSIQDDWLALCLQEGSGVDLHKNVFGEFKKRIKEADYGGTKAKLDLRNGFLSDRKVILLLQVLSSRAVIAKLEFKAEDISNAVNYCKRIKLFNH